LQTSMTYPTTIEADIAALCALGLKRRSTISA
jgi:hypothetical protein